MMMIKSLGKSQSCMVSKIRIIWKRARTFSGHLGPASLRTINANLPEGVRVVDGYRVRKGFSAQAQAESRRYSYYLPISALRGQPLSELQSILREYQHAPQCSPPRMRAHNM